MSIHPYSPDLLEKILSLFHTTVHTVNAAHYSQEQLDAWSPASPDKQRWAHRLSQSHTIVVMHSEQVIAFGNILQNGELDMLYVHALHQRKGAGTLVLEALLSYAKQRQIKVVQTEASITAKPFFESHGFFVETEQHKIHNGATFINFRMKKEL